MLYLPLALAWLSAVASATSTTPAPTPNPTDSPVMPSGNVPATCVQLYGQEYSKISVCDDMQDYDKFPIPNCLVVALGNNGATEAVQTLTDRCNSPDYGLDVFKFWMYACAMNNDEFCPERLWDKNTAAPDVTPFLEGPEVQKARVAFADGIAVTKMVWQAVDNEGNPDGPSYDELPGCAFANGVRLNLPTRVQFWFGATGMPTMAPTDTPAPNMVNTPAPTVEGQTPAPTVDPYATLYTAIGKAYIECDANALVTAVRVFIEEPRDETHYFVMDAPFWNGLKDLTSMTTLQVSNLGLSHEQSDGSLNTLICNLVQLKELNLSENAIQIVSACISDLVDLVSLDLSLNSLGEGNDGQSGGVPGLPDTIGLLLNLEYLDISKNKLKQLPESIGDLPKLANLFMGHNLITEFPQNMKVSFWRESLIALNLKYNEFTALPEDLNQLHKLQELSIQWNKITALPSNMTGLFHLKILDVSNNKLETLPDSIADCDAVTWLILTQNEIGEISDAVADMESIQTLQASNNKINFISPLFGDLKKLYKLELQYNYLTTFPNVVADLDKLWYMDLSNNNLMDLPDFVSESLVHADIRNNKLLKCNPYLGGFDKAKFWTTGSEGATPVGYSFWCDYPDLDFCSGYSKFPTKQPTNFPSLKPTAVPTYKKTTTKSPSMRPTEPPTKAPVKAPTDDSASPSVSLWAGLLVGPLAMLALGRRL